MWRWAVSGQRALVWGPLGCGVRFDHVLVVDGTRSVRKNNVLKRMLQPPVTSEGSGGAWVNSG